MNNFLTQLVAPLLYSVRGLPTNTKTWTRLYDAAGTNFNNPDTIYIEKTNINEKWNAGAEILITSHTRMYNDTQVRTIISASNAPISGYIAFKLNAPFIRPTTIVESTDFAVEIALLSRNIVFEGGPDTTMQHGGHFMVMHTPSVVQIIEGVDVRGFGQQGSLGKYPIHFHFCNDVSGSIVAKNTIRQSNQRCVVVHGTNKLRIEDNVVFDTKGHCYVLEDGIETGNEFIRNLGSQTGKPEKLIPNLGSNGDENDNQPSTFWITNPTNSFLGNVAAGSDDSGFWFDPKVRGTRAYLYPNYDPQSEPTTLFKDNVAHSCRGALVRSESLLSIYTVFSSLLTGTNTVLFFLNFSFQRVLYAPIHPGIGPRPWLRLMALKVTEIYFTVYIFIVVKTLSLPTAYSQIT
jgi:hypothetical protein